VRFGVVRELGLGLRRLSLLFFKLVRNEVNSHLDLPRFEAISGLQTVIRSLRCSLKPCGARAILLFRQRCSLCFLMLAGASSLEEVRRYFVTSLLLRYLASCFFTVTVLTLR
jgi:hypothetical protein